MSAVPLYLGRLQASLVGPRGARRDLLREVADHLEDAVEALEQSGVDGPTAQEVAIREFGTPAEVAPGLQKTLAVSSAHRTGRALLLGLLPQPLLWDQGLRLSSGSSGSAPSLPFTDAVESVLEALGFAGILLSLVAITATTVGTHRFDVGRRFTRGVGWAAALVATALPVMAVASLWSRGADHLLWMELVVLLMLPMLVAVHSARGSLIAARATAQTL